MKLHEILKEIDRLRSVEGRSPNKPTPKQWQGDLTGCQTGLEMRCRLS